MIAAQYGTQGTRYTGWLTSAPWIEDPDRFIGIGWESAVRCQGLFARYPFEKS